MLREPIEGLKRAGLVILTGSDAVKSESRAATVDEIRRHNVHAPIIMERHEPTGLRSPVTPSDQPVDVPLAALGDKSVMCFSGLGSPGGFERQVRALAGKYVGERRFRDHHAYTAADVKSLQSAALSAGADVLVTTEKDWVKLAELPQVQEGLPIWRLDVEARFDDSDGTILTTTALAVTAGTRP